MSPLSRGPYTNYVILHVFTTYMRKGCCSILLILRVGILMSIGNSPEVLSQRIGVRIILGGRLGVLERRPLCNGHGRFFCRELKISGLTSGQTPIFEG